MNRKKSQESYSQNLRKQEPNNYSCSSPDGRINNSSKKETDRKIGENNNQRKAEANPKIKQKIIPNININPEDSNWMNRHK